MWQAIETAPAFGYPLGMFVVIAVLPGYTTDPYCVWRSDDGFARWPHPFPPTHWAALPEYPSPNK